MSDHDKLKPFTFHGADFDPIKKKDKDAKGLCPFCQHDDRKFSVNLETQQWQCLNAKRCGRTGNLFSFFQQLLDVAKKQTTTQHYKELAEDRPGIPWQLFRDNGLVIDFLFADPRWLIPVRSRRGGLISLYVYQEGGDVLRTAGMPLHPWRLDTMKGRGPVYICEGEWDALALERLRKELGRSASVISVPGAQMMKEEWVSTQFNGRDIYLFYDNDNAGHEGTRRGAEKLKSARSVHGLQWNATFPEGWDIRDHVYECMDEKRQSVKTVWDGLISMAEPLSGGTGKIIDEKAHKLPKRDKVATVLRDFTKTGIHLDRNMKDGVVIMFATVLSIQLPGDPLWVFVVGPAGTGKTMFLNSFMMSPWCVFRSSLTPRSLISGYINDGEDPSLIPQLTGRCLVLKDYTEIMTMSADDREEMYGVLRGAYDGHAQKTFGNGVHREYDDCYFSLLAGVTNAIHGDNRAALGERFLKFTLLDGTAYNPESHIRAAISGVRKEREVEKMLQRVVAAFCNKDLEELKIPTVPKWIEDRVVSLVQVIAFLRTTVPLSHKGDELAYRPAPEVATRLAKQIIKLGICICIVQGKTKFDEDVYRLMAKTAHDTAYGWNLDVFLHLFKLYPTPAFREALQTKLAMPLTTLTRRLDAMETIHIIEQKPFATKKKGPGRPNKGYALTPKLHQLWSKAKVPKL